jgi:hypothetical protein
MSGALVGSSLIYDRVQISETQKQKEMNQAISMGIQPGVYYSILDCREVKLQDTTNETVKIVRVQNPWKDAVEWNGAYNDDDEVWTPKMKAYFEGLSSTKVHRWFSNDGVFCMKIEDFAQYFNTMYIVRDYPENYEGVKYMHSWDPSNGYPHKKNTDWIKNRQYVFKVTDQTPVEFTFVLQQADPRFVSSNSPSYNSKLLKIGYIVCKIASTEDELVFYHESKEVFRKELIRKRFVHGSITLPIGKYAIIPVTENAGDCSNYQLKIYFDSDFITLLSHGYKVILENEATIDPVEKKINTKEMFKKMNDRLHKGGKYDNVLGNVSSMRVRTTKPSQVEQLLKQEIKVSTWAKRVLIPFS